MKNAKVDVGAFGGAGVEAVMKAADVVTKGFQALAAETAEYSQRAMDEGTSAFGKISEARSLDAVVAVQSEYAKAAYEAYVGQLTKVGEIVGQMAREASSTYGFPTFGK